jgi:hypothetical protein
VPSSKLSNHAFLTASPEWVRAVYTAVILLAAFTANVTVSYNKRTLTDRI